MRMDYWNRCKYWNTVIDDNGIFESENTEIRQPRGDQAVGFKVYDYLDD